VGYYNTHLRKTSDQTGISKSKIERGMVIKCKYQRKDKVLKPYLIFVLQPKWPNTTKGKLHGLSLDNIPPGKFLEIAEIYKEIISVSPKVKKLDLPKIKINEASKTFYTSEIKTEKQLTAAYRTFNLLELSSIMAVNYDWGRFDMIDTREKRRKIEEEARERRDNNVTN
jgi:hypothetical protein